MSWPGHDPATAAAIGPLIGRNDYEETRPHGSRSSGHDSAGADAVQTQGASEASEQDLPQRKGNRYLRWLWRSLAAIGFGRK